MHHTIQCSIVCELQKLGFGIQCPQVYQHVHSFDQNQARKILGLELAPHSVAHLTIFWEYVWNVDLAPAGPAALVCALGTMSRRLTVHRRAQGRAFFVVCH